MQNTRGIRPLSGAAVDFTGGFNLLSGDEPKKAAQGAG
jgi:hypothetical protein